MATNEEIKARLETFIDDELQGYSINDISYTFSESKKKCKDKDYGLFIPKTCARCNNVIMFHGRDCSADVLPEREQRLLCRLITKEARLQEEIISILMESDTVEVNSAAPPTHSSPNSVFQNRGYGYTQKPPACPDWDEGIEWEDYRTLIQHWDKANVQDSAHVKYIAFRAALQKKGGDKGRFALVDYAPDDVILSKNDIIETCLLALDKTFGTSDYKRLAQILRDFVENKRTGSVSMAEYIAKTDQCIARLNKMDQKMGGKIVAVFMMENANLTPDQHAMLLNDIDFDNAAAADILTRTRQYLSKLGEKLTSKATASGVFY